MKRQTYPLFYSFFGDCLQAITLRGDREKYWLWDISNKGYEDRWEEVLPELMTILDVPNIDVLKMLYDVSPKDIAGDIGRFGDLTAEVQVALRLHEFGFNQIRKLKRRKTLSQPDYTASFNGMPFIVEVIRIREDAEEMARAYDHKSINIFPLMWSLTRKIELRLPKLERQLLIYPNHKKIAAVAYSDEEPAAFMREYDAASIGGTVLKIAAGKINHVLIMSTKLRGGDFIIPEIKQRTYVSKV